MRPMLRSTARCRKQSSCQRAKRTLFALSSLPANMARHWYPRTAGTSLAGQVVGAGIIVDVSRYFNRIMEIDSGRRRVRVQPGVVRNELNLALAPHGLFFAPETSTQNRAMIGGMVGNNSCGANSVVYGSTREHLISARAVLSDGSIAEFGPISSAEFAAKCSGSSLDGSDLPRHQPFAWQRQYS